MVLKKVPEPTSPTQMERPLRSATEVMAGSQVTICTVSAYRPPSTRKPLSAPPSAKELVPL